MDYSQYFDYDKVRADLATRFPGLVKKSGPPPDEVVEGLLPYMLKTADNWANYAKSTQSALLGRLAYLDEQIDKEVNNGPGKRAVEQALATFGPVIGKERATQLGAGVVGKELADKIEPLIQQRKLLSQIVYPASIGQSGSWAEKVTPRSFDNGVVSTKKSGKFLEGVAGSSLFGGSHGSYFGLTEAESPMDDAAAADTINKLREIDPFYQAIFKNRVESRKEDKGDVVLKGIGYLTASSPEFLGVGSVTKSAELATDTKVGKAIAKAVGKTDAGKKAYEIARHSLDTAKMFAGHSIITGSPEQAPQSAVTGALVGATGAVMPKGLGPVGGALGFAVPMTASRLATEGKFDSNKTIDELLTGGALWFFHLPGKAAKSGVELRQLNEQIKEARGVDLLRDSGSVTEGYRTLRKIVKAQKAFAEEQAKAAQTQEWNDILGIKTEKPAETVQAEQPQTQKPEDAKPQEPIVQQSQEVPTPKSYDQWLPRIRTTLNTDSDTRHMAKARDFVESVSKSESYTDKQKEDLFSYLKTTAAASTTRRDFIRNAKEHIGQNFTGIQSEFIKGSDNATLTQLYNAYKRVPYGQPGQFSHLTVTYNTGYEKGAPVVKGIAVQNTKDVKTGDLGEKFSNLDHTSRMSEDYGPNVAMVSEFVQHYERDNGESIDRVQKLHQVSSDAMKTIKQQLTAQGYLNIIFKSDSGSMLLLKEHPQYVERAEGAATQIGDILKDKNDADTKEAINLHLYMQDQLGPNYIQHLGINKWKNVQDLIKRSQIFASKGPTPDINPDGYNLPEVNGKKMVPVVFLEDHKDKTETDGRAPADADVQRLQADALGVEPALDGSIPGVIKSFIVHKETDNPELGSVLGKLTSSAATPEELAIMRKYGAKQIIYVSAAKWRGGRELNKLYYISPDSYRVLSSEHNDMVNEAGESIPTYVKAYKQEMYYVDAAIKRIQMQRAATRLQKKIASLQTEEDYAKWFKEDVLREQDVDEEQPTDEQISEATSTADRVFEAMGYSPMAMQIPFAKQHHQAVLKNYFVRQLISPRERGHDFYFQGLPDDIAKRIKADNEIILGAGARNFYIADMIENNSIDIFEGTNPEGARTEYGKRITENLDPRKIKTLGDLYAAYPDAAVYVRGKRPPVEDVGGIRAQIIVGLGPEGTGQAVYMRGHEMRMQSGADNDNDKTSITFEDGLKWNDALLNRYNNKDYILPANDLAEYAVQNNIQDLNEARARMEAGEKTAKSEKPDIASFFDGQRMLDNGQAVLNAKSSIGMLMSFDRVLRTLAEKKHPIMIDGQAYYIPTGAEYDAKMKHPKKMVVDAKHGGGVPWPEMRRRIVNDLVGHEGAADVLLGVRGKGGTWVKQSDPVYEDTAELFRKVFSYNYAEGRNWTPDEVLRTMDLYASKYKPTTQLEKTVMALREPLSMEWNPIEVPGFSYNSLRDRAKAIEGFSIDTGGHTFTKKLKELGLTNRKAIKNWMPSQGQIDQIFEAYSANATITQKPIDAKGKTNKYYQLALDRQGRAIARLENLARVLKLDTKRGPEESANGYGSRLKQSIEEVLEPGVARLMAADMLRKSNDFIINDVMTITTEEMLRRYEKYVPEQQRSQVYELLNGVAAATKAVRARRISRPEYTKLVETSYQKLDDMMKSNPEDKNLEGFIGTLMIGSAYRPDQGMSDTIDRIGWSRWQGTEVLKAFGQHANEVWSDVKGGYVTEKEKPKTEQQKVEELKEETPTDISKAQIIRKNSELVFDTIISKVGGSRLMPNDTNVRKAKKAVTRLLNNPLGTWENGVEFINIVLKRPENKRDYDKYPMDKIELETVVRSAREFDRAMTAWKKGKPMLAGRFMWNNTTGETMARTTPWSYKWFQDIVGVYNRNEASFSAHSNTANELIGDAYKLYGTPLRLGEMLYDAHTLKMGKDAIMSKYALKEDEYGELMGNNILGKYRGLMDRLWIIMKNAHEFHKMNVATRMRKNGISEDRIRDVINAMVLKRVENYFPRYVDDLENIIEGKATTLAERIVNGEASPAEVRREYGMMHERHRTKSALDIEKDLEKVLHTYIGKVIPWNQRQQAIYFNDKMMDRFDKEVRTAKGTEREKALVDLRGFFFRATNDLVGNSSRYVQPEVIGNDKDGFKMSYMTPGGQYMELDLKTNDAIEANRRMLKYKIDPFNQVTNNVSNAMLALSFAKNIGLSIGSSFRNRAQKLLPVMKSGFKRAFAELKFYAEKDYILEEENKTKSYKSIVEDAFKRAGLTYTQVHGETGQTMDVTETYQRMNDLILERIEPNKKKLWTLQKSRELTEVASKIAEIGSSASYQKNGKTKRILPKGLAFSGAELSNRQYAFRLGFHPVFEYYMDLYERAGSGLTRSQAIDLASSKAIEAGKRMVDLTQFDYHGYNSPEIMRKRGVGGATLRLATQFKKFTINNYKLTKEVLFEAMMEAKENKGKERIINEKAGTAARFITTHAALAAITGYYGIGLYNYLQDDFAAYIVSLWKYFTGEKKDQPYILQKETPLPYAVGPVFGDITSLGLIAGGIGDNTLDEWLVYHAAPRGPRNAIKTAEILNPDMTNAERLPKVAKLFGMPVKEKWQK